ncbi:hypothetical protein ALC57_14553, partial [Trachymyrmex cornetzi]
NKTTYDRRDRKGNSDEEEEKRSVEPQAGQRWKGRSSDRGEGAIGGEPRGAPRRPHLLRNNPETDEPPPPSSYSIFRNDFDSITMVTTAIIGAVLGFAYMTNKTWRNIEYSNNFASVNNNKKQIGALCHEWFDVDDNGNLTLLELAVHGYLPIERYRLTLPSPIFTKSSISLKVQSSVTTMTTEIPVALIPVAFVTSGSYQYSRIANQRACFVVSSLAINSYGYSVRAG